MNLPIVILRVDLTKHCVFLFLKIYFLTGARPEFASAVLDPSTGEMTQEVCKWNDVLRVQGISADLAKQFFIVYILK